MELGELEQLALGTDRAAALAALMPGTTEHDYWRGVFLQHEGRLDEVDEILRTWADRYGGYQDDFHSRLSRRQLLAKAQRDLAAVAEEIRHETGTSLDDRAEVVVQAQRYPNRLHPAQIDDANVLSEAIRRRPGLADVTDAAIPLLLGSAPVPATRRVILQRLQRVDLPGTLELVLADLSDKDGSNGRFGALPIHTQLTLAQLETLAERMPSLRAQSPWVDAVLARFAPPAWVDLRTDREELARVIDRAYAFAQGLAPSFNTLKATLLYHRLELDRAAGVHDRARLRAYLELPRQARWIPRARHETPSSDRLVQPNAPAAGVLGLASIGNDEPLLRELFSRLLLEDAWETWADVVDSDWLLEVAAVAHLLAGNAVEPWTRLVDGARREALKHRVDIDLAPQNPPWFGASDDVSLEVDVKNVRELEVKVFRVDALAYWLAKNAEIDTSIDLDGMIPSGPERKLTFDFAPIRRHRVRLDFPECKRPGTYVIELIGNGRSSRALVRKGTLRHLFRTTAGGTLVTVTNEEGSLLPDARLWLGGRELAPRDPVNGGGIVVPFGTRAERSTVLLVHGDIVQRADLLRPAEEATLRAGFEVQRESLVANTTARVLACPKLTIGHAPASLALLADARVDIAVTLVDGTSTSRTQPVVLRNDEDLVLELPVPEGATSLTLTLRAQVRITSRQETIEISDTTTASLNASHLTELTSMFHLGRAGDSFVLSFLGKTGEPVAGRAIGLTLQHRVTHSPLQVTLETDEHGRIDLGPLDGKVTRVIATLPNGQAQSWLVTPEDDPITTLIHTVEGATIVLSRTNGTRALTDLTLVEHRRGANAVDLGQRLVLADRCVMIEGLPPGEYRLDFPQNTGRASTFLMVAPRGDGVRTAPAASAAAQAWVRVRDVLMELTDESPLVRRIEVEGDHLVIRLSGTSEATRAHVEATHFIADSANDRGWDRSGPRAPHMTRLLRNVATYVSGRDIGDEYRYVLERRQAPRRPGMMLEKPSLLLNPWALRATETARFEPSAGGAYGAPPPAPGMAMPAPAAARRAHSMRVAGQGAAQELRAPSVDFLPISAPVLANLRPDTDGAVRVPLASLGVDAQSVRVIVADPLLATPLTAEVTLPAREPRARDLRLRLALDPARHYHEARRIDGVPAGTTLVVPDVRTGKIELVGTLGRAHQLLVTRLGDASSLKELSFVTEWPSLDDATKRARYSKYACHELNLFLWRKDPAFFESTIRPSLVHKREKSVVDRFLLGEDLGAFLEPWTFGRLNTLERILVAAALPDARASLARLVGDAVDLLAPDPEGDAQLVATLLGAAALEVGGGAMASAMEIAEPEAELLFAVSSDEAADDADTGAMERPKAKKAPRPLAKSEAPAPKGASRGGGGIGGRALDADLAERDGAETLYRGADKTQEWAEVQWWKRRIDEIDASLIEPNRFWRDLALHVLQHGTPERGIFSAPFLSPHIGLCQNSFAEAMTALAFLDLPFVATPSETSLEDTRFTLTPRSHALAASSSLVEIPAPADGVSSVLIGQSYVRSDDRWEWVEGEQREKRVTGELIAGVVYRCLVVVTNPTSATEKLDLLLQIPKGSMPVDSGFITRTMPLSLDPYATESFDYAFYFPIAGTFTHFPAHVTKNGALLAHAPARELSVVREPSTVDLASWSHVSQHGTLDDVLGFLDRANLGRTDLGRIAWRMHDAEAFRRVTDLLAGRHLYDDRLWAYALLHRDRRRAEEWLRHQEDFLRQGSPLDGLADPAVRGWYQHLEYAPLINARAHRLGAQRRIANSALDTQYRAFLELIAHRAKPSADDLLSAAHYLLAMDRVEEAIPLLGRVPPEEVTARIQFDYLTAYVACYRGEVATAKELASRWLSHGVDRWRHRFVALAQMIDEMGTTEKPAVVDADNRDQKMAEAASRQASLDIAVRGGSIALTHANLARCQLRFFKLDIELVFSRQPFVQSDVERFSFIEPGLAIDVPLSGASTTVPIPAGLAGANVVIEAVAPGLRRSVAHYAHDLGVHVAHAFGQLKVVRASTGAPLSAVYVKVYGRERSGRVAFFKDGYTDLRGRFDYATLSTDDLDRVERFALLVASDDAGATITEAAPPPR
ncbi:MAG: hypothetical protein U0270_10540 [Labilithrix sp.]